MLLLLLLMLLLSLSGWEILSGSEASDIVDKISYDLPESIGSTLATEADCSFPNKLLWVHKLDLQLMGHVRLLSRTRHLRVVRPLVIVVGAVGGFNLGQINFEVVVSVRYPVLVALKLRVSGWCRHYSRSSKQ